MLMVVNVKSISLYLCEYSDNYWKKAQIEVQVTEVPCRWHDEETTSVQYSVQK